MEKGRESGTSSAAYPTHIITLDVYRRRSRAIDRAGVGGGRMPG